MMANVRPSVVSVGLVIMNAEGAMSVPEPRNSRVHVFRLIPVDQWNATWQKMPTWSAEGIARIAARRMN
jgi:hypothetical protein